MEFYDKEYCLEVWGDYACFTRPEFKVERVSYDVITPSAARAIFESIFWKPAIRWEITRIDILSDIQWFSIMRNEVGAVASKKLDPIFIEDKRQQRNATVLRDVHYRIYARMVYIPPQARKGQKQSSENRSDENPAKYQQMFERRAANGQCFSQPYLGTREFSAYFKLITPESTIDMQPIALTKDLGYMIYDMDFDSNPLKPDPLFFKCEIVNGVITVPPKGSNQILK